jgi:hypothetical protein
MSEVPIRQRDPSSSTRAFFTSRSNAGDWHRDDEPCSSAPDAGYITADLADVNDVVESEDLCDECLWPAPAHTEITDG